MSGVKTLVLIESDKLRNLQENLKSVYDLSEKYDTLRHQAEKSKHKKCTSCALSSENVSKNLAEKHPAPLSNSGENETEKNHTLKEELSHQIQSQQAEMKPNPDIDTSVSTTDNCAWYCVL